MPGDNRSTDFYTETMSFNYKDYLKKNSLEHSRTLTILFPWVPLGKTTREDATYQRRDAWVHAGKITNCKHWY